MKAIISLLSLFVLSLIPASEPTPVVREEYKLIIFEGSDWCRNCRRLEKEILSKEKFSEFLNRNSIEVEKVDFPQRKKQSRDIKAYNKSIADKYGFEGVFPTMVLATSGSDQFLKLSDYTNQSVETMIARLESKMKLLQ